MHHEDLGVTIDEIEDNDDKRAPLKIGFTIEEPEILQELVGEMGSNLNVIARATGTRVQQRGSRITAQGDRDALRQLRSIIVQLVSVISAGFEISGADIDQASRILAETPDLDLKKLYQEVIHIGSRTISPRSIRQRTYLKAMQDKELVFGVGPAGTGKTYLAMAMALSALMNQQVKRIILCRPAVEAGENLGFLPGDLVEKVNPYLRPLFDALNDFVGYERTQRMIEKEIIEIAPLAFMRGRTLSDAFVILDEAQNTTQEQMKMLLTRTGRNSRVVVTGDPSQVDLDYGRRSGLNHALQLLAHVDEIGVVHFTDVDVVRHPLVSIIIRAYQDADDRKKHHNS